MQLQPAGAADPVEADGEEQIDDFVGDQEATEHGEGHGGEDFAADAAGKDHGKDGDDGDAFREQLGTKAVDGAFDDRLPQLVQRLNIFQAAAFFDRFAEIDEHDDPG